MILDLIRLPLGLTMSLSRNSGRGMILMPGDSQIYNLYDNSNRNLKILISINESKKNINYISITRTGEPFHFQFLIYLQLIPNFPEMFHFMLPRAKGL